MTGYWSVTVVAAFRRLVAIAGADLSVGAVVAYVRSWVISTLHFAPDWNFGSSRVGFCRAASRPSRLACCATCYDPNPRLTEPAKSNREICFISTSCTQSARSVN